MGNQYQARTVTSTSTQKPKSQFTAPPVVQPKRRRQKTTELPEWNPESRSGDNILQRLIDSPAQAKLSIGQPNDKYEQEADRVARDVVQRLYTPSLTNTAEPGPVINLKSMNLNPPVQRSSALTGGEASSELESSIHRARGGGQALDAGLQQSMGSAMGADFSGVKVHTDSTSNQLNRSIQARAFTTGSDVFFKKGEYNPDSKGGQELIAHELTHVVQQGGAGVQRSSDTVVQRWLKDGKTGNVMNEKVALKHLTSNKIPEQLAQITIDVAKKHKDPVQKAELLRIGRQAMVLANRIPEWNPAKIGTELKYYMMAPAHAEEPWTEKDASGTGRGSRTETLTQKVVQHKDIGEYIPAKKLKTIIETITEKHYAVKPLIPSYWVQDALSSDKNFKDVTHNGLRPVVTPASFDGAYPRPPVSPSKPLYRGTGLTPLQIYQQGGFRGWGIDDDLYFHSMTIQTNRRHSAYLSTTKIKTKAISFATNNKGYVYEINPMNLFAIDLTVLSAFPDEKEVAVPYVIPFDSITKIIDMNLNELEIQKMKIDGSNAFERYFQQIDAISGFGAQQQQKAWQDMVNGDFQSIDEEEVADQKKMKHQFDNAMKDPSLRVQATEEVFIKYLKNEGKKTYAILKSAYQNNQGKSDLKKPKATKSVYNFLLGRNSPFDKVKLDDGSGQKRVVEIKPLKELDKTTKVTQLNDFFDLVTDWWFNHYAPQHQDEL